MNLKRVIGSHGGNLQEMWETIRLVQRGAIAPALSQVYPLRAAADAVRLVQTNKHLGKIGVLGLAPTVGLGVSDPQLRAAIEADKLTPLRRADPL